MPATARVPAAVPTDGKRDAHVAAAGNPVDVAELGDVELLTRFAESHCEAAFQQLVTRHGGLVLSVCRRVLKTEADAEDAFQATFLVLSRKAGAIRQGGALAAWLYQTAFRLATRARQRKYRRREEPLEVDVMQAPASLLQIAAEHERTIVDEELARLPDHLRLPLFLCCLEGRSREEAAEILGWSIGSVKGRLERGRQLLRRRLLLRGVSLTVVLTAFQWQPITAAAAVPTVPAALLSATVRGGVDYADGLTPVSDVSPGALILAEGNSMMLGLSAIKLFAASLVATGVLALGGLGVAGSRTESLDPLSSKLSSASANSSGRLVAYFADGDEKASGKSKESKEGEKPVKAGPKDGEGPKKVGPKDGEQPRKPGPRDGEGPVKAGPRDGEGPKKPGPKDGDVPKVGGDGAKAGGKENPKSAPAERVKERASKSPEESGAAVKKPGVAGFEPETAREKLLYQMILELRAELEAMKRASAGQREKSGERSEKEAIPVKSREGENPKKPAF